MDVKEAVAAAKSYVTDIFSSERISAVQLEEVEFDDKQLVWNITVGFWRRADDEDFPYASQLQAALSRVAKQRSFKIVRLRDSDGQVLSLKHRPMPGVD